MTKPTLYSFASPLFHDLADIMATSAAPEFDVFVAESSSREPIQYREKARAILDALQCSERSGQPAMIYADADCYFFAPCAQDVLDKLATYEAVFQGDGKGGIGTGFFAMRATPKMIDFWHRVATTERFYSGSEWPGFDEAAVNEWKGEIDWVLLPENEYWTPCYLLNNESFPDWNLPDGALPKTVRMMHMSCVRPPDKRRVLAQAIEQDHTNHGTPGPFLQHSTQLNCLISIGCRCNPGAAPTPPVPLPTSLL